jgi:hypothetical protein
MLVGYGVSEGIFLSPIRGWGARYRIHPTFTPNNILTEKNHFQKWSIEFLKKIFHKENLQWH